MAFRPEISNICRRSILEASFESLPSLFRPRTALGCEPRKIKLLGRETSNHAQCLVFL